MKKLAPEISAFVLMAFLNMIIGCNYYHVKSTQPTSGAPGIYAIAPNLPGIKTPVVPGSTINITLKSGERIEKMQVSKVKPEKIEGTQTATLKGRSFTVEKSIMIADILNVESLDSPAVSFGTEFKKKSNKYVILHQGENVWHLKNVYLNDDRKEMVGVIEPLPPEHSYYLTAKIPGVNKYKFDAKNPQNNPTYEVHIYISEYTEGQDSQITVPLASIKKIQLYEDDVPTAVLSAVGVLVASLAVIAIIILLTKSSCPFVYVSDGQSYHFTGEMYGGAIFSSLERDDYMPLPRLTPTNGQYQLKISNELLERQYTNLAELMVVEHPDNLNVLLDRNGKIQTLLSPVYPTMAIAGNSHEYTSAVSSKDGSSYLFDEDNAEGTDLNCLTLAFKRPLNSKSGKLILNAKNSLWLDYIYGKFNEQFGTYFNTYAEKQKRVPAKKNNQWSFDQGIPLSVYVETENGWEFVDYFNVVGPLASRDLVMPVDLTRVKGENVKIKLQCGFMFWEVDYASMDFSENIPVEINRLTPSSAVDEKGNEVSSLLSATDNKYLIQPEVGDEVIVQYPASVSRTGYRQTAFLHSKGYYEYIRNYKNRPNLIYLNSFKKKGAFTRFSKDRYHELVNGKDLFATALN